MSAQLFPRQPKRLRQPKKSVLRDQLALAADTIIREREERLELGRIVEIRAIDHLPWWRRILSRFARRESNPPIACAGARRD